MIEKEKLAPFISLFTPTNRYILLESQLKPRTFKKLPDGKCPRGLKKLIKKANKHLRNFGDAYVWNKGKKQIEFTRLILGVDNYIREIKKIKKVESILRISEST